MEMPNLIILNYFNIAWINVNKINVHLFDGNFMYNV